MKFCSLYSGSSGNSIFVGSEKAKILIDAGLPGKKIDEALKQAAEEPGETVNGFIKTAIKERMDKLNAGATEPDGGTQAEA